MPWLSRSNWAKTVLYICLASCVCRRALWYLLRVSSRVVRAEESLLYSSSIPLLASTLRNCACFSCSFARLSLSSSSSCCLTRRRLALPIKRAVPAPACPVSSPCRHVPSSFNRQLAPATVSSPCWERIPIVVKTIVATDSQSVFPFPLSSLTAVSKRSHLPRLLSCVPPVLLLIVLISRRQSLISSAASSASAAAACEGATTSASSKPASSSIYSMRPASSLSP